MVLVWIMLIMIQHAGGSHSSSYETTSIRCLRMHSDLAPEAGGDKGKDDGDDCGDIGKMMTCG